MKITKVQERKSGTSGKKYFVINADGDGKDYLSFDTVAADIVGQEVQANTYEKAGTWYMRNISKADGAFVTEGTGSSSTKTKNKYEDDKKIGVTLSYAKDVLVAIAIASMEQDIEFKRYEALAFIRQELEGLHNAFLDLLEKVEN